MAEYRMSAESYGVIMAMITLVDALDRKGVVTSQEVAERFEAAAKSMDVMGEVPGIGPEGAAAAGAIFEYMANNLSALSQPTKPGGKKNPMKIIDGGKDDDEPDPAA